MGTHATTRIANATDYVESHTRWDGFGNEIRAYLSHPDKGWQKSIEEFRQRLSQDEQGTQGLTQWLDQLEAFIDNTVKNPSIDTVMALLSMVSLNRHQVLPHCAEDNLLNYWGEGHPGYVGVLNHEKNPDGLCFADMNPDDEDEDNESDKDESLIPLVDYDIHTPVVARKIEPQYKVVRIYTIGDSAENEQNANQSEKENLKINHNEYIDVKFTGLSESELAQHILALPYFWRDLYTIGKSPKNVLRDKSNVWRGEGIFHFMNKLKEFYSPTSDYDLFSREENPTEASFNDEERQENINNVFQLIYSLIPFDFFINSMATHLFIALPGQVLPITQAEIKAGYEIDMSIGIDAKRLATIYVHVPQFNLEQHKAMFTEFSTQAKQRQQAFLDKHQLDFVPMFALNYALKPVDIQKGNIDAKTVPFISFDYEYNLTLLMDCQRDMEILAKQK